MSKIKMNYENASAMLGTLTQMRRQTEEYYQALKKADMGLDWKVSAAENIRTDLIKWEKKLLADVKLMDEYIKTLREISDGFSDMEKGLSRKSNEMAYAMKKIAALLALFSPSLISTVAWFSALRSIGKVKELFGIGKKTKKSNGSVMEKSAEQIAAQKKAEEERIKAEEAAKRERERQERLSQLRSNTELNQQLCQEQINRIKKSGNGYTKEVGNCNVSSATMLLNRRLYLDQGESGTKFTLQDVYDANGCTIVNGPTQNYKGNLYGYDGYEFTGDSGKWANKKYTNADGTVYQMIEEKKSNISNFDQYIAQLLEKHPEGICLRNTKANHVFVITDVQTLADGKVQYYVQDPVNRYTGPLEGSHQYRKSVIEKKDTDIFQSLDFIAYLQ